MSRFCRLDVSYKLFNSGFKIILERNLISQRTKEALAARRAAGKRLGRPFGAKSLRLKLSGKEHFIHNLLMQKISKSAIARRLHVDRGTLRLFIQNNNLDQISE